jgi:hypothetical protein
MKKGLQYHHKTNYINQKLPKIYAKHHKKIILQKNKRDGEVMSISFGSFSDKEG